MPQKTHKRDNHTRRRGGGGAVHNTFIGNGAAAAAGAAAAGAAAAGAAPAAATATLTPMATLTASSLDHPNPNQQTREKELQEQQDSPSFSEEEDPPLFQHDDHHGEPPTLSEQTTTTHSLTNTDYCTTIDSTTTHTQHTSSPPNKKHSTTTYNQIGKKREPVQTQLHFQVASKKLKRTPVVATSSPSSTPSAPTTGSPFACLVSTPSSSFLSPYFSPDQVELTLPTISSNHNNQTTNLRQDQTNQILFQVLTDAFDKIEELKGSGTGSKKSACIVLANCYRLLIYYAPHLLAKAVYLSLNKVCPDYMGVEVGVGDSIITKSIITTYGRSEAAIKQDLSKYEDLGALAAASSCRVRTLFPPPRLTIEAVYDELREIAACSGHHAQQRKRDKISKLLVSAKKNEPKYIVRFLQQKMRIGAQTATVYQALAYAFTLTRPAMGGGNAISDTRAEASKPEAAAVEDRLAVMEQVVRAGLCEVPNIDTMVEHLLNGEDETTLPEKVVITPGIPVQPMLAKPTKGLGEVLERLSNVRFTCEFKYDGERAQIHVISPGEIKIFSRNLEDLTLKYPDLVQIVHEAIKPEVQDCVIDCEVVAFDTEKKQILPFQVLTTRKRKDVHVDSVKVRVCAFAFDCMRLNAKSLLREPLSQRRECLWKAVKEIPFKIQYAKHREMSSIEEIDTFLQDSIEGSCEGLMIKTLDDKASYEPSKRSLNWLKVKKDYIDGSSIADSLDLVPIGAFYGKGRRSKSYGVYLLAVWNPESETYQTVCKAGTGFSDEALTSLYESMSAKQIDEMKPYYEVAERMIPDVWLEPCQVWECRAADLSLSPIHTAAIGDKGTDKGIGLRFPRFLRVRTDKSPEQATTSQQVIEMYESQFANASSKPGEEEDDDDNE